MPGADESAGPEPLVVGRRVELGAPTAVAADEFLAAVEASRALHRPWVAPPDTPVAFAAYQRRTARRDHHGFVARARNDGRLAGVVNINNVVLRSFRSGHLGYYAFTGAEGRGLMTEAVALVAAYAFDELGLHRLEANIQPGNVNSSALVRRLGFRLEGFSPDYLFIDGAWRDHERWALLADEFAAGRAAHTAD